MEKTKTCKDCGRTFSETRQYFGQFKNTRVNGQVVIGFRNSCRECMAATTAKHSAINPELVSKKNKLRSDRSSAAGGAFTQTELSTVRKLLGNRCRFCDTPLEDGGHIEHLTPVSRGGSSNLRNITLSCAKCNLAKTNKTLSEFIEWRRERTLVIRDINPNYENPDKPLGKYGRRA